MDNCNVGKISYRYKITSKLYPHIAKNKKALNVIILNTYHTTHTKRQRKDTQQTQDRKQYKQSKPNRKKHFFYSCYFTPPGGDGLG